MLSKMTNEKLEELLITAKNEIEYRNNCKLASAEIKKILKKYSVSLSDLKELNSVTIRKSKNRKVSENNKRNKSIPPKYRDPVSNKDWTGRGRSPQWVKEICQKENIDIQQFKSDKRFLIS